MGPQLLRLVRETWVPVTFVSVLLAIVLVAVPWYYRTYEGALPERGLSAAELEWAAAYAPWRTHVGDTLELAYDHKTSLDGELGQILDQIGGCGTELLRQAGIAPTERLRPVLDFAVAACASADAALAEYRAEGEIPTAGTTARVLTALGAIREAEVELRALLLAHRPLPRRGGLVAESRIEPRLSRAVSAVLPADVLCWSEDEWPQVRSELAAIGLERDPALRREVNAYRFRVHASPAVCGTLARFASGEGETGAEPPAPEVAAALTAVLHASRHAVGAAEDEAGAQCRAVEGITEAARRLGADGSSADALARLARARSGCP